MRPTALLSICLLIGLAAPTWAQATGTATYFLHAEGKCERDQVRLYMDQKDTDDGMMDTCGAFGIGAAAGFQLTYPGRDAVGARIESGSKAKIHAYLTTAQPDKVAVSGSLVAANARCTAPDVEKDVVSNYVAPSWFDFVLDCSFDKTSEASVKPNLTLIIKSKTSYFVGYDGDHTSRIDLSSLAVAPPANATNSSAPPPGEDAPGWPVWAVATGTGLAVAIRARRRT